MRYTARTGADDDHQAATGPQPLALTARRRPAAAQQPRTSAQWRIRPVTNLLPISPIRRTRRRSRLERYPQDRHAASAAVLAVIACACARSRSPRTMQSRATRVLCAACSSCRVASPMSTAPRASGGSLTVPSSRAVPILLSFRLRLTAPRNASRSGEFSTSAAPGRTVA